MLSDVLSKMSADSRRLVDDVNALLHAKKMEAETGEKQVYSRTSLEPITRLRKTVEELEIAENSDPDAQFIEDKLKDIFGG